MRSFWLDSYLWVHLAGVAVVPIALEGCLLGFSASNSLLPPAIELLLVGAIGTLPILWMQWQKPFSIYSLVFLAVQPKWLSDDQRRMLRRFKAPLGKGLSLVTAGVLLLALWQLYQLAPIAWEASTIVPGGAVGGLVLAAVSFLLSNLFLQVPVSVAQVMLTDEQTFALTEPYPVKAIARDFTLLGIRVGQILPRLRATAPVAEAVAGAAAGSPGQAATRQDQPKSAPRFKEPQPASDAQNSAKATLKEATTTPQKKHNLVPVEVIDAEFRELDAEEWDEEWDEADHSPGVIAGEESLPRTAPTQLEASVQSSPAVAEADTEPSAEPENPIADSVSADLEQAALPLFQEEVFQEAVTASEAPAPSDPDIAQPTAATPDPAVPTAPPIDLVDSSDQDVADSIAPEDPPLEPIAEPLEDQPEATIAGLAADEMLHISSMTLLEAEDVSEEGAVDLSAVEVVTAEVVEDVSEDSAVPRETIETWLEDTWEEEVRG